MMLCEDSKRKVSLFNKLLKNLALTINSSGTKLALDLIGIRGMTNATN